MNLMIDFETLDTRPSAVVLSVGLVLFTEREVVSTRYFKFDATSQLKSGRTVSMDTVVWWNKQSAEARDVLHPRQSDIGIFGFSCSLNDWLDENGVDSNTLKVWANPAQFDLPILDSVTEEYGPFYDHRNARCFRTYGADIDLKKYATRKGTHHNALDDAMYQTECLLNYWEAQRGQK